jgi:hypothetical protein
MMEDIGEKSLLNDGGAVPKREDQSSADEDTALARQNQNAKGATEAAPVIHALNASLD